MQLELEVAQFLLMHGANTKSEKLLLPLTVLQKTPLMTHLLLQANTIIAPGLLYGAAQIPNNQKNIKLLLRYGAAANPLDRKNEPAIFEAIKSKSLANVRALIKGGSDLNYAVTVRTWTIQEGGSFQKKDCNTALHIAVRDGTPEIIKLLVQRGADPYKWDKSEESPIEIAIREKSVSKILAFIEGGMNLNHTDKKGQTPLHLAASYGTPEIIKLLVQRGAEPCISDKKSQTPLDIAVSDDTPEIIKLLVQHGADPYKCGQYKQSPIERAIREKSVSKILAFIEGGMNLNNPDKDGQTPLHIAVWHGTPEIIKLLVQRGADPCIADKDGQTPLHLAAQYGNSKSIKLLIQQGGMNLNQSNKKGQTALHLAAMCDNPKSINLLIQYGAAPSILDNQGYSPLMLAIKSFSSESLFAFLEEKLYSPEEGQAALRFALNCNIPIILNLLLQHKIDLTYPDKDGQTALHIAAKHYRAENIKLLLQHGTDPYQCDNSGKTPLFIAIENRHFDNVQAFLEPGIDLSYTNQAGQTALHIAADTSGPYDITPKTIKLLIKHGADLYQCDNSGKIPLFIAIENQLPRHVQAFIKGGMNLNYTSPDGMTALHIAAKTEYGSSEIIELLIRHGAAPYQCDPLGNPPFFNAIKYYRLAKCFLFKRQIITAFIKSGIDLNYTNKEGKTALHIAAKDGTSGIVELLIEHGANPNIKDNDGLTPLDLLLADESDNSMSTEG
ncbi:hypothetical protein PHSC3_000325 [Chlamydiales bacterium STE3]|nr:hypothetical protein PHSC3_000325 [Chlamydiales bacterium STE3]